MKETPAPSSDEFAIQSRKDRLDVSRIFLTYLASVGDVVETSRTTGTPIDDVLFLARTELWDQKLQELSIVKMTSKDEALQAARDRNRMACYVQALRLRGVIDVTLKQIYEDPENVEKFCRERDKKGEPFLSMKPLKELMDAAERVHGLLYRALGDTVAKSMEGEEGKSGDYPKRIRDLHLTVVNQMASVTPTELDRAVIRPAVKQAGANEPDKAFIDVGSVLDG